MLPGLARYSVSSLMSGQAQDSSLFAPYSPTFSSIHSMDKTQVYPSDCYRRQEYTARTTSTPNSPQQFWPNASNAWCSPPAMQYGGNMTAYNHNPGECNNIRTFAVNYQQLTVDV